MITDLSSLSHGEADMYFGMGENAHRQIGAYTGIPASYYDKLMTSPQLLAENVNHWLKDKAVQAQLNPERRMIRTLDGNVRAFLSDRYRRIDNEMVAEAVLPVIGKMPALTSSPAKSQTTACI